MSAIPSHNPQIETEIRNAIANYLSRRAVSENYLIGKGVLLSPPYSFDTHPEDGVVKVTIRGKNASFEVKCARVVASEYRPTIDFVQFTEERAPRIIRLTPLQPARLKLLNIVKPGSSLPARDFYNATRKSSGETQVNARRRWGELRTEYGFDTTYDDASKVFRRGSAIPVSEPEPRPNNARLHRAYWNSIYETHNGHCNKCGQKVRYADVDEGDHGLIDHRRPVLIGGGDERENLQLLCQVCNNLKNTVCQSCPIGYRCERCTWAYPEKFHDAIVVRLTPRDAAELAEEAHKQAIDPLQFAQGLFASALQRFRRKE